MIVEAFTLLQLSDINSRKCQAKRCTPRRMGPSRDLGPIKIGGSWAAAQLAQSGHDIGVGYSRAEQLKTKSCNRSWLRWAESVIRYAAVLSVRPSRPVHSLRVRTGTSIVQCHLSSGISRSLAGSFQVKVKVPSLTTPYSNEDCRRRGKWV